jgi:ERCC4-related helicase
MATAFLRVPSRIIDQVKVSNGFKAEESGKFQRLGEICCDLAERHGKAVVFTQLREIAAHLADFLAGVFGRAGLMLHGQTAVAKRRELVEAFQRGEGRHFSICRSRPAARS